MSEEWIDVRGLRIWARIGVPEEERAQPQELHVDFSMQPRRKFGKMKEEIQATIDYDAACQAVKKLAARSERRLVETLADEIAELLLCDFGAQCVRVKIRKFVLPDTEWVGVRIERTQEG